MGKKEKIFPLNTVGGKIQALRHNAGLSRSELYDMVYPICGRYRGAGSDSSKERTVLNWESEKTQLDYETLKAMCKILNCSSDYLFGLEECTNKTSQFIHDETGLSQDAVSLLQLYNSPLGSDEKLKTLNLIIETEGLNDGNFSSLVDTITGFLRFDIEPDKNIIYTATQKGIGPFKSRKSLSGKGIIYNPTEAHFWLSDLEDIYYLKVRDSIKKLKEFYRQKKAPDTSR